MSKIITLKEKFAKKPAQVEVKVEATEKKNKKK